MKHIKINIDEDYDMVIWIDGMIDIFECNNTLLRILFLDDIKNESEAWEQICKQLPVTSAKIIKKYVDNMIFMQILLELFIYSFDI